MSRINVVTGLGDDLVALGNRDAALTIDALISGGDANDSLTSDGGNDTLLGDEGNDTLRGAAGRDRLRGGGGKDYLFGEGGRDLLYGEGGNDSLHGSFDADLLDGGRGNDQLHGGGHRDSLYGGAGADTFYRTDRLFHDEPFFDAERSEAVVDEPSAYTTPRPANLGFLILPQAIITTQVTRTILYAGGAS